MNLEERQHAYEDKKKIIVMENQEGSNVKCVREDDTDIAEMTENGRRA